MHFKTRLSLLLAALVAVSALSFSLRAADPEKSIHNADTKVKVTLTNPTAAPASMIWVDFEGAEQDYGSLPPGGSTELETYPGHLWLLKQNGKTLSRFRTGSGAQQTWAIAANSTPSPPPTPTPPPTPETPSTPPAGGTGSNFTAAQAKEFLDYHNAKRTEVGTPPVAWSPTLAAEAQAWADHMANTGNFEHRPRQGANATQHGENLAAGYGGGYAPLSGAKDWYGEKRLYVAGSAVTQTSYLETGHYTQMVWRGTTEIGAGVAIGKVGQLKGWTIVVCNYNPPGNMIGQKPY